MASEGFIFDEFILDPADRQLSRAGQRVELNSRYLDALVLMLREAGGLVTKDRFLDEVWQGVPVTDEALTQCIKTLRKVLNDDVASPRFIETVPKHGYRFIATVERWQGPVVAATPLDEPGSVYTPLQRFLVTGLAGTAGGALAGMMGGLLYGFAAASQSPTGGGALSAVLVLWLLTIVLATIGAAGVGFGIAAADFVRPRNLVATLAGGALGGMVVGAFARLLGLDAFSLLFGAAPQYFTGASEGAMLGAAAGFAAWYTLRRPSAPWGRVILSSAAIGGVAGVVISLAGGRLLGGSLAALAAHFPQSTLRLDPLGALVGETGFGATSQAISAGLEAMLFCACLSVMLAYAAKRSQQSL